MRDVAALAGVGLKTVSRVVNGVPTVDPALVTRVNAAATKLGYRPNLTASSLARRDGRTATIGLLLEDVANPFSAAVHRAVEDVARARRFQVLTGSLDEDPDRERQLAHTLIDRRVDGLIIMPAGSDQSYLVPEQQAGIPLVFLDRHPSLIAADTVASDHRSGALRAVGHLVTVGHRRVGYLGDNLSIATARARFDGYRQALEQAGVEVESVLVRHGLHTVDAAVKATNDILSIVGRPTALFSSQNLVTMGTVRALHTAALQHRIAVVGFDDFALADLLQPGISVVAQDPAALGRLAAEMLFNRIAGDHASPRTHVLPTTFIQRGSGEIPPLESH
jgi:LacI family transcriptional regulator